MSLIQKVAVAGASGFVGKYLVEALLAKGFQVVALSRKDRSKENTPQLTWAQCDLFSRRDTEKALKGCDYAFYLTHSMIPTATLAQGNFADYDVVLADNFARAARVNQLKKLIYLGGIIPQDHSLSRHLLSRREVERTLQESGVPLVALRAGIVLGPEGSSFRMMYNLVKRLPLMICPSWTGTLSNPISIWDTVSSLMFALESENLKPNFYDIGGKTTLSYIEMMRLLGKKMGSRKIFLMVPFFSPHLSKLWVSKVTGAPKELVYPLVESLKTHMVPNVNHSLPKALTDSFLSYEESIERTLEASKRLRETPRAFQKSKGQGVKEVCSIQRLETLYRFDAEEVSGLYFSWIDKVLPFLKVKSSRGRVGIHLRGLQSPLLSMEKSEKVSSESYVVFFIKEGYLSVGKGRGRLVFRTVISGRNTMVEIHEFVPKLPWLLYKYTQALVHLATMRMFNSYLLKIQRNIKEKKNLKSKAQK